MKNKLVTRRTFVGGLISASSVALVSAAAAPVLNRAAGKSTVCVFSKHLQWLDFKGVGEFAAEVGFDGVDLTVRPGGHVAPEKVRDDLPKAVQEIRKAGLEVPMMTTAITNADDPLTAAILETAASLGIRYYRLGYFRYSDDEPVRTTLEHARAQLTKLAELNREYRMCGEYQNHAGKNYFGASIWDLWTVTDEIPPELIGIQFDLRHASVEGARNWPVDFRLVADRVHTIVAKDFRWAGTRGADLEDCPLGQGIADFPAFLPLLRKRSFSGPISLHYEYPLGGVDRGSRNPDLDRREIFAAMQRDLLVLRRWLEP